MAKVATYLYQYLDIMANSTAKIFIKEANGLQRKVKTVVDQ